MTIKDIKVPNIGEFKNVEVIEVLIAKGQKVKKNEPLITIESDKSSVEIPSTDEGTISSINLRIGDKVSEGDKILEIEISKNTNKIDEIKTSKQKSLTDDIEEKESDAKKVINTDNLIIKDFSSKKNFSITKSEKICKRARS